MFKVGDSVRVINKDLGHYNCKGLVIVSHIGDPVGSIKVEFSNGFSRCFYKYELEKIRMKPVIVLSDGTVVEVSQETEDNIRAAMVKPVTYHIGQKFINKNGSNAGTVWLLIKIDTREFGKLCGLVCLTKGMYYARTWGYPVEVKSITKITQGELSKIMGCGQFELAKAV